MTESEVEKAAFECKNCRAPYGGWKVFCPNCREWNAIIRREGLSHSVSPQARMAETAGYGGVESSVTKMSDITADEPARISTNIPAFDEVLGGGLVKGSVVLIAGDPGSGKSTLMLQAICETSSTLNSLLVTAEETREQVKGRAIRLGVRDEELVLAVDDEISRIIACACSTKSKAVVVDSLSAVMNSAKPGERGGGKQLQYCLEEITRHAKSSNTAFLVICQSTKVGDYAGPRVVEHICDALVMMTTLGDSGRVELSARKNRFGCTQIKTTLKFDPCNGRLVSDEHEAESRQRAD